MTTRSQEMEGATWDLNMVQPDPQTTNDQMGSVRGIKATNAPESIATALLPPTLAKRKSQL